MAAPHFIVDLPERLPRIRLQIFAAGATLYKQITNCSRRATKRTEPGALDVSWIAVYERQVYLIVRSPFSRGKNADNRK